MKTLKMHNLWMGFYFLFEVDQFMFHRVEPVDWGLADENDC